METATIVTLKMWLFLLDDIRIQDIVENTFHLRLKVEVNNVFIASIYAGWLSQPAEQWHGLYFQ